MDHSKEVETLITVFLKMSLFKNNIDICVVAVSSEKMDKKKKRSPLCALL